jgi:hypothetical protein
MLILILSLLCTTSALPVYSRMYLRGLRGVENERIQAEYINKGITYLEHAVFTAAKQGLAQYTTEPFQGCEIYARSNMLAPFGLDKVTCENIVNGIHTLVSERFPDSELLYDAAKKRYTLKWD